MFPRFHVIMFRSRSVDDEIKSMLSPNWFFFMSGFAGIQPAGKRSWTVAEVTGAQPLLWMESWPSNTWSFAANVGVSLIISIIGIELPSSIEKFAVLDFCRLY